VAVTFACGPLFDLWLNRGHRIPKEVIDMEALSLHVSVLSLVVSAISLGIALGSLKNNRRPHK
jgi:hypothetical protein